jgi:hypothetical protein
MNVSIRAHYYILVECPVEPFGCADKYNLYCFELFPALIPSLFRKLCASFLPIQTRCLALYHLADRLFFRASSPFCFH